MAKKKEPINLMPAKSKVFLSKTLVEHTTWSFQYYRLENKS